MVDSELGYSETPMNGYGIKRARTTGQIRTWEIPKAENALEIVNTELGCKIVPGNYILFEGRKKTYVGEAKNLYIRLKSHIKKPDVKIQKWDHATIITDARSATQSEFNDAVVRKALELYLIKLLKANRINVVSQGEDQELNQSQNFIVFTLKKELVTILLRKNIIYKELEEKGQEEVLGDDLRKLLKNRGKEIQKWSSSEAMIDNIKTFIRRGSLKKKGWQITIRGSKPDSFLGSFKRGTGSLLVSRDGVILIPLAEVQKVIQDPTAYEQNTIDIYIVFSDYKVILTYKNNTLDITKYKLVK